MDATSVPAVQFYRPQILERRARLQTAAGSVSADYLNDLLLEIDAALQRIDTGTYGLCETCREPLEADRLQADPLVRFCVDHLSATELQAHQQDLDLATRIQSRLLPPSNFTLPPWETHYSYQPAGPLGGDYCEVTALGDSQSLFFSVGDVAGKGVAASLLMAHLSAIFRSLLSLPLPLAEATSRANRLFCQSTLTAHYATLVCGRATGEGVELCNAGHCPPLLVRRDTIERLDTAGLPLGLFGSAEYLVTRISLAAGESLVLYSDGVTEAQDPGGNEFGEVGLKHSLRRHFGGAADALGRGVVEDVLRFRGRCPPADDLTLLVVRRHDG